VCLFVIHVLSIIRSPCVCVDGDACRADRVLGFVCFRVLPILPPFLRSWMDSTTKARALQKLSMLYNMVGYPEMPDNYTTVQVSETNFFSNILSGSQYAFAGMVASLQEPSDRTKWEMTADTINAYYDPTLNEIVLPAGILQPPYFSMMYPASMVFGGIGVIIGHEITHGFDNEGSDYDGTGKLTDWWLPQTRVNFNERVDCVIKQYDQFEILPGLYVNGKLTRMLSVMLWVLVAEMWCVCVRAICIPLHSSLYILSTPLILCVWNRNS
jgi:Peptidase family M13